MVSFPFGSEVGMWDLIEYIPVFLIIAYFSSLNRICINNFKVESLNDF